MKSFQDEKMELFDLIKYISNHYGNFDQEDINDDFEIIFNNYKNDIDKAINCMVDVKSNL